jgi:hypothetical protein
MRLRSERDQSGSSMRSVEVVEVQQPLPSKEEQTFVSEQRERFASSA